MKVETFKLYEDRDDVTLTAYILDDSKEMLNGKPRPAILICPGGAYLICSDREAEPVAMRFLSMGYNAFVLRYSVYHGADGNTWPEDTSKLPPVKPEMAYPTPLLEMGKAFLLIHEHEKEWMVDGNQIGICGFSAGGHNCAMYSCLWGSPILTEALHAPKELLRPACCILGYAFIDYIQNLKADMDEYTKQSYRLMYQDYFGKDDPSEEEMKIGCANLLVNKENPPTFLWSTCGDQGVPAQHHTFRMACALADNKIPYEVHVFQDGQHGLVLADKSTAGAKDQINPATGKWVELVETWLDKWLKLPIE